MPMINFTPEDLVLYLYKEFPPEQMANVERAIQTDWTLREKLNVLRTSMDRLDLLGTSPRTEIVLNVLKYARKKTGAPV